MIKVYFGKPGSGKSTLADENRCSAFARVYCINSGSERYWEQKENTDCRLLLANTEDLSLADITIISLEDRPWLLQHVASKIVEASNSGKNISILTEKYSECLRSIFDNAECFYFFACSPGAIGDIPVECKPNAMGIDRILSYNDEFEKHKYFVYSK